MKNKTGPPVEGADFYGRDKEIEYVWQRILDGNNIILPSPRRVGKTSFAKKMLAIAQKNGWDTIEINLEHVHSELDFIGLFVDELKTLSWWERVKDRGTKIAEQIKSLKPTFSYEGAVVSLEWQSQKTDIYKELRALLNHQKDTLIFFDELAVLLNEIVKQENGAQNVESYLHWLRSLRQVSGTKIRWIFSSSVGIENFTFAHRLSNTINDVTPYQLKSFDRETSIGLIRQLEQGANIEFDAAIREKVVDRIIFCLPFFLQIVFEKMTALIKIEGAATDLALVDKAYEAIIEESYLNTWIERLKEQYGNFEVDAFLLLKHICQETEGSKRDNLLQILSAKYSDNDKAEDILSTLLYMLQNDGYLMGEGGRYYFRSPLIRDFWYNRHVK